MTPDERKEILNDIARQLTILEKQLKTYDQEDSAYFIEMALTGIRREVITIAS